MFTKPNKRYYLRSRQIPAATSSESQITFEDTTSINQNEHTNITSPTSPTSSFSLFQSPNSSPKSYELRSNTPSSTITVDSIDVVSEANANNPIPINGIKRTRKTWTKEMNEYILRTYLQITSMETDTKTYLQSLHTKFSEKFPQMQVNRQRIGVQRRAIINNNLLSQEKINEIYEQVRSELAQASNEPETLKYLTQTPQNSQKGQRMRWTQKHNETIVRAYYKITNLETNKTAYRKHLHEEFIAEYPHLSYITEQRVADQKRFIFLNKYLSDKRLREIREEVESELQRNANQNEINATNENITEHEGFVPEISTLNSNENTQPLASTELEQLTNSHESEIVELNTDVKIEETFLQALDYFKFMDPTKRNFIPKQKSSKKLSKLVTYINSMILPKYVNEETDFQKMQLIIYCSAWTIAKLNGSKIELNAVNNTIKEKCKNRKPKWQSRLEKKVDDLRAKIGRLIQYINGNRSKHLVKHVENIKNKYKIHTTHEAVNTQLNHFLDTLKQKLSVASCRLKRYKACTLRKIQNKNFITNEGIFYRSLKQHSSNNIRESQNNTLMPQQHTIQPNDLHLFWTHIWESPKTYNSQADWLIKEKENYSHIPTMSFDFIPVDVFNEIMAKLHNWKSPGSDCIHNYWYKKFTYLHPFIHTHINKFIHNPQTIPEYLLKGITHMIPKDQEDLSNPAKYRPITCLQTLYKIITACLAQVVYNHITDYNILAEEQKGCRKFSQGCKEQLTIDSVILKQVQKKKKDLFSMYIDYKKAYDSVPHDWLIEILDIYKINPLIIAFLKNIMTKWSTQLRLHTNTNTIETETIQIQRGIFQGDTFSPLWFCLALNPLSNQLKSLNTGYLFKLQNDTNHTCTPINYKINHLLFMDDIKLFASTQHELEQLANYTEQFSKDINMEFGINKCKINSIKAGKIYQHHYQLSSGESIEPLDIGETYKYLGYQQSKQIQTKDTKFEIIKQFRHRLNTIMKTQLNAKNIIKAINSYAIPLLTYSFGIINWSQTDLKKLQRNINTIMTKNRKHHPRSCVQRITLPRKEGGRGVIDIMNLHNKQVGNLRKYFQNKKQTSTLHRAIVQNDQKLSPLNLSDECPQLNENQLDNKHKIAEWAQKSLHGRHRQNLDQPNVDKSASNEWLRRGDLFPETEGFMIAIQDQIIETRNYQKHIIKLPNVQNDSCRRCSSAPETIQHITGACKSIVESDYKHRHDQVASIIHQKIARKYNLIPSNQPSQPYYKYNPESILENSSHKLYYDRAILTDKTIHFNRPDLTLIDKLNKTAQIIDIAIPNTHNLQDTIAHKLSKYTELKDEIVRMWKLREVTIVPIVLSSTGVIPKQLHKSIKTLDLHEYTYSQLQKACILNTCRLVRKFLQL